MVSGAEAGERLCSTLPQNDVAYLVKGLFYKGQEKVLVKMYRVWFISRRVIPGFRTSSEPQRGED